MKYISIGVEDFRELIESKALFPFLASFIGLMLELFGISNVNVVIVPACTLLLYYLFRKKIDINLATKVNGTLAIVLLLIFTVLMVITSGHVEGKPLSNLFWLLLPFGPILIVGLLMGQNIFLYLTAWLTYASSFAYLAGLRTLKNKRMILIGFFVISCIGINVVLYGNRPVVKYGGHGFSYMNGFSSTDFSDYMVYSSHSKLVQMDSSFVIEKEEDMPILDGAEACYPLYAAFAKTVYKDIDKIEEDYLQEDNYYNGKIVSFTNSIVGFNRLLMGDVDIFFGARPSSYQLQEAQDFGVELEIVPIAREVFVFFVEENSPVDCLDIDQIKAIYHGDIINWSKLGGGDQEILAFQRPQNSGSQTMMEYFMGDVPLKEAQTIEKVSAMDGVIKQVAQYNNEKGALGYSFRYFLEELNQEKGVKMLSVDGVYPSLENIENREYPIIADVCLIYRKDNSNPYIQKMKDFILSEDGQKMIRQTGYAGINSISTK